MDATVTFSFWLCDGRLRARGQLMDIQEGQSDLKGLLALLRRQARLILLTAAAICALVLVWLLTVTPIFQATALVLVDPAQKNLLDPGERATPSAATESARVDSEVEILRSDATALAVIAREGLADDPLFRAQPRLRDRLAALVSDGADEPSEGKLLLQLKDQTTVRRRGLTYLITVSVRSPDAVQAARLANATVETYVARQVDAKIQMALAARDVLQSRINTARQAVQQSEQALDNFIARTLETTPAAPGSRVAGLRDTLAAADERAGEAEARAARLADTGLLGDWGAETLAEGPLAALQAQWQSLSTAVTDRPGDPVRDNLAQAEENLAEAATDRLQVLREDVTSHEGTVSALRRQLREELLREGLDPPTLATIYELQQEAEIARRQYQTHLQRLRELEAQASLQIADSRLVSPATPPVYASFPNKRQMMAVALILGLGLGVGLALLREYYVGGVTSVRQLRNVLHLPVAGAVPLVSGEGGTIADAMANAPLSPFAEAIRRVRASLDQAKGEGKRVILVTSSLSGEGKSTLALALARAYGLAGRRVLLIDSDLRHPSLHEIMGLVPDQSLLDYLSGATGAASGFCTRDPLSGAEVILGAGHAEQPTDQLLASEAFAGLLSEARDAFDIVILDSPPVLPVVDARYIAPLVDAVVLVVQAAATGQNDLRQCVSQIQEAITPSTQLSVVLNQEAEGQSSYRYNGHANAPTGFRALPLRR